MTADDTLDAMIAMGWGDTPQSKIPANWREKRGPDTPEMHPERKHGGDLPRKIHRRFSKLSLKNKIRR